MPVPRLLCLSVLVLLLAGCAEKAPQAPVQETPFVPEASTDQVDWSDAISMQSCGTIVVVSACTYGGTALGNPTGPADERPTYVHDAADRQLTGGHLVLDWSAISPFESALQFTATVYGDCPDSCTPVRGLGTATGSSPLSLEIPAVALDPGSRIVVEVLPTDGFVAGEKTTVGQPFHLAGTLGFVTAPVVDEPVAEADDGV
jgi:hypothetical protein